MNFLSYDLFGPVHFHCNIQQEPQCEILRRKIFIEHTANHYQKETRYWQDSPVETLSWEFEPEGLEIYECEDRWNMILKRTNLDFLTMDVPIEGTQSGIVCSKKKLKILLPSFQSLTEEINSVVSEKHELE